MAPYQLAVSKKIKVQIGKIRKKDRTLYDYLIKKIKEISKEPHHCKPLRHGLKGFCRVHI